MRIKIPKYAKLECKKALKLRKSLPKYKRFGLTKTQANKLGVNSGVERAKQIIRNKTVSLKDAKSIIAFYNRFSKCKTAKCQGAHKLWGGRDFALYLKSEIKKKI